MLHEWDLMSTCSNLNDDNSVIVYVITTFWLKVDVGLIYQKRTEYVQTVIYKQLEMNFIMYPTVIQYRKKE